MISKGTVSCVLVILTVAGCLSEDCPPPEILDRCECHVDAQGLPALRCPNVESWDEIYAIFETGVVSHFSSVEIINSPSLTELPSEAFSNVKIFALRFFQTGLQHLGINVFTEAQASSTKTLYIKHNSNFEHLEDDVSGMAALEELFVSYNNIGNLTGKMFGKRPGLPYLDFSHNHIKEIEPNYFSELNDVHTMILSFNELTTDSMDMDALTLHDGAEEFYLDLAFNSLSEGLPAEALGGEVKPKGLILSHNNIRFFNESLFAPTIEEMLDRYSNQTNTYILLDGNDLECGCEMKWTIKHPGRAILQEGTCHDGRLVSALTEADFVHC